MKTSETIAQLAPALVAFQGAVDRIAKDRKNPHFKNDYATLDQLIDETKEKLSEFGLAVMQNAAGNTEGNVVLTTRLIHTSGEWIETDELIMKPVKSDPQAMGSAITYAKRYQYSAFLNLATGEDDDGNAASGGQADADRDRRVQEARERAMQNRQGNNGGNTGGNNRNGGALTTPNTPPVSNAPTTADQGGSVELINGGQRTALERMVTMLDNKWAGESIGSRLLTQELGRLGKADISELTVEEAPAVLQVLNRSVRNKPEIN